MSTGKRFAPYPTSDRLILDLSDFDDPTRPGDFDFSRVQRQSKIDLGVDLPVYDVSEVSWSRITFRATAILPASELDRILSGTADRDTDTALLVSMVCRATKFRHGIALRPAGEGRWVGEALLDRGDVRGTVQLVPLLARTTAFPGTDGIPRPRGTILATGATLSLYVDEPTRLVEGALDVRWDDFARSEDGWRNQHAEDVFHLEPYGDAPVLYLNEGHAQLRQLLENDSNRGADAALRDVTAAMVAQTVWTQLTVTALGAIDYDDESGNAELPSGGWQRDLLLAFLPRMYAEVAEELQARRAAADFTDPHGLPSLMARVGSAVQDLVRTSKHVEAAIRAHDAIREQMEEVQS